jgi:tryptophanyl-tRNA synthetase
VLGIDGKEKMSKSLNNHIELAATADETKKRVLEMMTDPARIKRTDPGNPDICNVYTMHKIFSPQSDIDMVNVECRRAGIGCVECKTLYAKNLNHELKPLREKREEIASKKGLVDEILLDGSKRARKIAQKTMQEVREAVQLP